MGDGSPWAPSLKIPAALNATVFPVKRTFRSALKYAVADLSYVFLLRDLMKSAVTQMDAKLARSHRSTRR